MSNHTQDGILDTQINGCINFQCARCHTPYTFDSTSILFTKDPSSNTGVDDVTVYTSHIHHHCSHCQSPLSFTLEVWEQPSGVANTAYCDEKNIALFDGEFDISYYGHSTLDIISYDEYSQDDE